MSVYLINFLVYSMAMVGLLFVCLLVYKKTMVNNKFAKNNSELHIENALNLSQRKTLYVVKAGNEKFLIASDVERTSFLAKLGQNETITAAAIAQEPAKAETPEAPSVDYSEIMSVIKKTNRKQPILKEIIKKLDAQSELNRQIAAHRGK